MSLSIEMRSASVGQKPLELSKRPEEAGTESREWDRGGAFAVQSKAIRLVAGEFGARRFIFVGEPGAAVRRTPRFFLDPAHDVPHFGRCRSHSW